MANMFSGNQEKKIPKDLKSCYKYDNVTKELWGMCESAEVWGKILFWVIIIFGVIIAITSSLSSEEVTKGTYYIYTDIETTFDIDLFLATVFETGIYALIEYLLYHIIALLIGSLASLVQHTRITANIALYNSAKAEGITDDFEEENVKEETMKIENIKSGKCEICECEREKLTYAKIVDQMGTRYRYICEDCIKNHNATPAQKK